MRLWWGKIFDGLGGVRKISVVFCWGAKIFCEIFVGYEKKSEISEISSSPLPPIKNESPLIFRKRPFRGAGLPVEHIWQDQ